MRLVRERDLTAGHFAAASGLITTTHLDQIGFMRHAAAVEALLDHGGRWVFNGHVLRPLVAGLAAYVPLAKPRRADYVLTRLFEHPVFAGIDQNALEENKGVAGFYGRGHNPMPRGGTAVNGIGPERLPIDWDLALATGGRILSHAGNEILGQRRRPRDQAAAGRSGRRLDIRRPGLMSILAIHPGAYYHIESFEMRMAGAAA